MRLWKLDGPAWCPGDRLVIVDRDGVINEDTGHVGTFRDFVWTEDAVDAVKWLDDHGYRIAVATNQAGIARGLYTEGEFDILMRAVDDELATRGARLDAVYYCPHHPSEGTPRYRRVCRCRKPAPGMLLAIVDDFGASKEDCVMIGDKPSDAGAAAAAGIRSVTYEGGSLLAFVKVLDEEWLSARGLRKGR